MLRIEIYDQNLLSLKSEKFDFKIEGEMKKENEEGEIKKEKQRRKNKDYKSPY